MFNNLKMAIRNLFRNGVYSVINITGLAVSLAAVIIIALWIDNELNFNRWYSSSDRLYVACHDDGRSGISETLINALRTEFPEIKRVSYFENTERVTLYIWDPYPPDSLYQLYESFHNPFRKTNDGNGRSENLWRQTQKSHLATDA
jgi:hypothetical protein